MKASDRATYESALRQSLEQFEEDNYTLPGLLHEDNRSVFIFQIIESLRRVEYYHHIRAVSMRDLQATYREAFDPLKAAVYHFQNGDVDEAFWLVFLATHFGKHRETGWKLARDVYWALGQGYNWTWKAVTRAPQDFYQWLITNYSNLKNDTTPRMFGNHRKYETLKPTSRRSTWRVIESYVNWVGSSHEEFLASFPDDIQNDKKLLFKALYDSMSSVLSFGRTGRFDYLTTLSNLDIAPILAGSACLKSSTGPIKGARLLFGGSTISNINATELENKVSQLDNYLQIGMQAIEDSLCNWQKSPARKIAFRG